MSRTRMSRAGIALVVGWFLVACEGTSGGERSTTWDALAISFSVGPAPTAAEACPPTRWVGRVAAGDTCPAPREAAGGVWTRGRLFDVAPGDPAPPDAGSAFCQYTWRPRVAAPPDVAALPSDGARTATVWLDRDCHALAAQAGVGTPARNALELVWTSLHAAYRDQVEAVPSLPPPLASGPPVRVAVLDSSPEAGSWPGANYHGQDVQRVIADLSCPPGSAHCASVLSEHLALYLESPGKPNFVEGGQFGDISRLAVTLWDAVRDWEVAGVPGQRLVVNASVAWDALYNGPDEVPLGGAYGSPRQAVQAVRLALEYARCRGALVVAATGNISGGLDAATGPMYPAAWEAESIDLPCGGGGSPQPLIRAAGAVDGADAWSQSTRDGGRARLVAPGELAIAPDAVTPGSSTELVSGSSMAAAVVSATAAVVWSYRPGLTADEVAELVYDAGVELTAEGPADFCLSTTGACADPVHRVSVCRAAQLAIDRAWAECVGTCPPVADDLGCPVDLAYAGTRTALTLAECVPVRDLAAALGSAYLINGEDLTYDVPIPFCGSTLRTDPSFPRGLGVLEPCPGLQFSSGKREPWAVWPQPDPEPCAACLRYWDSHGATITVAVNDERKEPLWDPIVVVSDGTSYDLGAVYSGALYPGKVYAFEKIDIPSGSSKYSAWIYFKESASTKSYSTYSALVDGK